MTGTELKRTLAEDVFYPPHESRKASAEYNQLHHLLVVVRDEPCWICGIRHSNGGNMETHHAHVEWAAANAVTFSKAFANAPQVTLGCVSTAPQNVNASVGAVSTTGFTLYGCRTDATATLTVYWMAME